MLKRIILIFISLEFLFFAFITFIVNSLFTVVANAGEYKFEIVDIIVPLLLLVFSLGIFFKKQKLGYISGLIALGFFLLLIAFMFFYIISGETVLITVQNGKELLSTSLTMSLLSFASGIYLLRVFKKE